MDAEKCHLQTVEEYLEAEQRSEVRHEYLYGTIHAMAGGSRRHNEICFQIAKGLDRQISDGPCRTYLADVKVRIRAMAGDLFYYPDVMVGCDPTDNHEYYLERPAVLFEVTSHSTELTDRREKLLAYQTIASLDCYVIVSQEQRRVECFRRRDDGWERLILSESEDRLDFTAIGVSLSLGEIYEGIEME